MQPTWYASQPIVYNVIDEIEQAKQKQCAIVLVKMLSEGSIDVRILEATQGYNKIAQVGKRYSDGSTGVKRAIIKHNFPKACLRVCGVNTDECVADTVKGIATTWPKSKIEIAREACNSNYKVSDTKLFKLCGENKNVVIIRRKK